jgi:hypothetical protein
MPRLDRANVEDSFFSVDSDFGINDEVWIVWMHPRLKYKWFVASGTVNKILITVDSRGGSFRYEIGFNGPLGFDRDEFCWECIGKTKEEAFSKIKDNYNPSSSDWMALILKELGHNPR